MRRADPLEWLLIAAALLAFAALGQSILVSANASLVNTLSAAVTASRATPPPAAADDAADASGMTSAQAAIDGMSTAVAADTAAKLDRHATWLALTNGVLVIVLVAATVVRSRQLRVRRSMHA